MTTKEQLIKQKEKIEAKIREIEEKKLKGYKGLIFKNDLKAEAIKWIKDFRRYDSSVGDFAEEKFMEFFNITEEDFVLENSIKKAFGESSK